LIIDVTNDAFDSPIQKQLDSETIRSILGLPRSAAEG
jgi:hypothetical protein